MKNKIFFVLVIILLFSFYSKASADGLCSPKGYTVLTINGINTDENGAETNALALKRKLLPTYNNQPLKVDYLYNATHLGGALDILDVIAQGVFDEKSDYDLTNMLSDASQKVTTQKVLLVGHSQGNFYANNFYEKVADKEGGVPSESIGVYGVASPASYVAGGGKYLTSDTDVVINKVAGRIMNVLKPNTHIVLQDGDDKNGHDFSGVYLKYKGDKIVSDIKSSLSELTNNDEQDSGSPCISPPEITALHKIEGVALASTDFIVNSTKNAVVAVADGIHNVTVAIANGIYNVLATTNIFKSSTANVAQTLPNVNTVTTLSPNVPTPAVAHVAVTSPTSKITKAPIIVAKTVPIAQVATAPVVNSHAAVAYIPTSSTASNNVVFHGNGGGGTTNTNITNTDNTNNNNSSDTTKDTTTTTDTNTNTNTNTTTNTDTDSANTTTSPDPNSPVITILGDNPEVLQANPDYRHSVYHDSGATALDKEGNVLNVKETDNVSLNGPGNYVVTYTASDADGNTATATRKVNVFTFKYVPDPFENNGHFFGHEWLLWIFNGSNIYDWSDVYVNGFLHEQFKLQDYSENSTYLDDSLQRGIFNHDPQQGFEKEDMSVSELEYNPQHNKDNITYNVAMQWDSSGYTFVISHDSIIDHTGHTDVANVNKNTWVGWDNLSNDFICSPTGIWELITTWFPPGYFGGENIVAKPYPVYIGTSDVPPSGPSSSSADIIFPTLVSANVTSPSTIDVTFSRDLDGSTVNSTGGEFTVSDHVVSDAQESDGVVTLTVSPQIVAGETPNVTFNSNNLKDLAGNSVISPSVAVATNSLTWDPTGPVVVPNSEKSITAFSFTSLNPEVDGVINETDHTISLTVPFGTDVTALIPTVTISTNSSIVQDGVPRNFSIPVIYAVIAVDGSSQNYTVNVTVASNQNQDTSTVPDNDTVTQLKIISDSQTISANNASSVVTVESQNALGTLTKVAATTYVNLSSTSATGLFASSPATGPCNDDWTKTKVTISKGDAHKSFCYKDSTAGTPTITVSAEGLSSDSQVFTIN